LVFSLFSRENGFFSLYLFQYSHIVATVLRVFALFQKNSEIFWGQSEKKSEKVGKKCKFKAIKKCKKLKSTFFKKEFKTNMCNKISGVKHRDPQIMRMYI